MAAGEPGRFRSADEIDAELARDATNAGERHAATCRAAMPSRGSQAGGLGRAHRREAALATFRATLGGFVDPDQRS